MSEEEKVTMEEAEAEAAEAEKGQPEETDEQAEAESAEPEAPASAEAPEEDEDLRTQFMRLSADFQNYRRRTEKEKTDIYAYANEKFAVQLLDVIDNFERATDAAPEGDKFAEGMLLILKQLQDVLSKNNVEEIPALGEAFDPNCHNAVMTEDNPDFESGKVCKVLQKGYMLNKKVIRPAMVCVAQ